MLGLSFVLKQAFLNLIRNRVDTHLILYFAPEYDHPFYDSNSGLILVGLAIFLLNKQFTARIRADDSHTAYVYFYGHDICC